MAEEGRKGGMSISLIQQPPNSPDFNVLDLGFFNAIQSLQMQGSTDTIDEMIAAVEKSFKNLDDVTVDRSFLTLQNVMSCCLECHGGNGYELPHMGKAKLSR